MHTTYKVCIDGEVQYRNVTPYTEPIMPPSARARTAVGMHPYQRKNIFQRILLRLGDWVQSRVATARISNALVPFIKSVTKKGAMEPTACHSKALNAALMSVPAVQDGQNNVVHQAVCKAMAKLCLDEKVELREKLDNALPASEHAQNDLLYAVNDSLAQSVSRAAEYYALEALKEIVEPNGAAYASIKFACVFLDMHLKVVSPDKDSVFLAGSIPPSSQMACISASPDSLLRKWFNAQPSCRQVEIRSKIIGISNDICLPGVNATHSERRLHAFAERMTEVLPEPRSQ